MKHLIFVALIFLSLQSFGQFAEVQGTIYDEENEPFISAVIVLRKDNVPVYHSFSENDGSFSIQGVNAGSYVFEVESEGYNTYQETVEIYPGKVIIKEVKMSLADEVLGPVIFIGRQIETENISGEVGKKRLESGPGTDIATTIKSNPKITFTNDGLSIGQNRPTATGYIFNNNSLIGPSPLVTEGMQAIGIMDNGISARFGGFSGGAIRYSSERVGLKPINRITLQSSSPLNAYHHNQGIWYHSKAYKVDDGLEKQGAYVKFGMSFLGVYDFKKDPRPLYEGAWELTEAARKNLETNPLSSSELIGGYVSSANFIKASDVKNVKARKDAARNNASMQWQIAWQPDWKTSIQLINRYQYLHAKQVSTPSQLFNSGNNPIQTNHFGHSQLIFTKKIITPYDRYGKKIVQDDELISSLYYAVEVDYQRSLSDFRHPVHNQNLFNYGHVGSFKTDREAVYRYNESEKLIYDPESKEYKQIRGFWEYTGMADNGVSYEPGKNNPILSNYTNELMQRIGEVQTLSSIQQAGGVINGFSLPNIYSLYFDMGNTSGNYAKSDNSQFSINAYTEAGIRPFKNKKLKHDLEFGLSFRQENNAGYSLAAANLWQLMPLLVNTHIDDRDPSQIKFSSLADGSFSDTVYYNPIAHASEQTTFDRNLRNVLIENGMSSETGYIDIQSINPELLDINMFSASELFNNGNSYVNYYGYDHTGKRTRGKKGINNFLNDETNRPIDSYRPSVGALWLQDRFVIKDLVVRAGLRFERFDANQPVLKDPYLLSPARTVNEVSEFDGNKVVHPSNVGEDYVVYVNDLNNPSAITGYRNGNDWYDQNGLLISDPSIIANNSNGGNIQPYLIEPNSKGPHPAAFEAYSPQVLVLPRIMFSFPLNTTTLFYFNYDKLAQNPDQGQIFTPYSDYLRLANGNAGVMANPNLKARVKTEYQLGFKQFVGERGSINISAAYASVNNDFNQFRMEYAHPYAYTTYSNVDFSTTKRFIAEYELNQDHLFFNVSYALQFADGTGSNTNSSAALLQVGQPNLRSIYPLDFDRRHSIKTQFTYYFGSTGKTLKYKGPYLKEQAILANTFITINMQSLSGNPYSAILQPISTAQGALGVAQRAQSKGNPQGSRMPWQFNTDMRIEKTFASRSESNDKSWSLYLTVNNLLNNRMVQSVFSYTGLANDDGFLNSPAGTQLTQNQLDANAFSMLYKMRLQENGRLASPRMAQLGCKLNF